MTYHIHPIDGRIEAAESKDSAARLWQRGFVRCSYAVWHGAWRTKDDTALLALELPSREWLDRQDEPAPDGVPPMAIALGR